MHIVDELIYERAPHLVHTPLWPVAKPVLYGLLGYGAAVDMADDIAGLSGADALGYISKLLSLRVMARGLDHLPRGGRCLVVCNHPTGIADGIAVADAIAKTRGDAIFFANADALRVNSRLAEALIPVEWVEAKRTRDKTRATLAAARAAFEAERCVVMFPAGRLARRDAKGRLVDPPWAPTAVSLAQKYAAPVVPVHVSGPNSFWFHLFNRFSKELRDITL
ncbi:MAG: 1-acyl-sn-glycerol-3-phosphate acyltransferase, partial [Asticcacaulis sp.]